MHFFLPWYANSGMNGNLEAAEKDGLILVLFMNPALYGYWAGGVTMPVKSDLTRIVFWRYCLCFIHCIKSFKIIEFPIYYLITSVNCLKLSEIDYFFLISFTTF